MANWLIGYDISDPRRLQRVHREILHHAVPLEYSIFLLTGTETQKSRCLAELEKLIEKKEDDLRCYPLPARGHQERIGIATLPPGIQWTGLPASLK